MYEKILHLAESNQRVCKTLVKYLFVNNITAKLLRDLLYRAFRVHPELQALITILEAAAMHPGRLNAPSLPRNGLWQSH